MKKILILCITLFCFIKADIVSDGIDLIKKESFSQDVLAGSIELYVETFGTTPTLAQLKSSGFLDASFPFSGSFSVGATSFTVTTTIIGAEQYQKDFFLNDYARGRVTTPSISGNNFITTFYFGRKAIYSKNLKTSGITFVQNTPPTGSANQTWWDTSKQQMYIYIGGWKSLNAKKLWIFRNIAELNAVSTINENDGAVIIDATGTSLVKYLYVSGAWRIIPQTIPFAYNGAF